MIFLVFAILLGLVDAYSSFNPGEEWNDISGKKINCHGGEVVYYDEYFWWFGENRATGVSLYRSVDLYNWEKLPDAFVPSGDPDPDGNDASPGRNLERPKVLYNDQTKQWVMHIHWENGQNYNEAKVMVAYSDEIEGPYKFYRTLRPNGHDSRDQTTFKDNDGKAYHFGSTNNNKDTLVTELSANYLDFTTHEFFSMAGKAFEASCIWRVSDTYFGIYSLCTGWAPNIGSSGYTFDLFNTWTETGPIAIDEPINTTYNSQAAYVFKVPGYEYAYIYVGDRWVASNPATSNTVWLPLSIRTGYPKLHWYESWDLSFFKDVDRYKRARSIVSGNTYLLLDKNGDAFVSRVSNRIVIAPDNTTINVKHLIESTGTPNIYKIKDADTNHYYESNDGILSEADVSSSASQQWRFILQEDGYYHIQNVYDDSYITTEGGANITGTPITLGSARSFGVYFDSNTYTYESVDIFSKDYRKEVRKMMTK